MACVWELAVREEAETALQKVRFARSFCGPCGVYRLQEEAFVELERAEAPADARAWSAPEMIAPKSGTLTTGWLVLAPWANRM